MTNFLYYYFFFSGGIGSGLFNDAPIINSYRSGKSDLSNKNGNRNSCDSSIITKFSPSGGSIIESGIGYLRNALFSNKNSGGGSGAGGGSGNGENSNEFGGEYRKLNLRAIDMEQEKPPPLRNGYVQDPLQQTQQLQQRNKNGNTNLGESKC